MSTILATNTNKEKPIISLIRPFSTFLKTGTDMQTSDHIYSIYHIGNKNSTPLWRAQDLRSRKKPRKQQYKIQTRRHYACDQRNRLAEDKSSSAKIMERNTLKGMKIAVFSVIKRTNLPKYQLVRCQGTTVCPQNGTSRMSLQSEQPHQSQSISDKRPKNTLRSPSKFPSARYLER